MQVVHPESVGPWVSRGADRPDDVVERGFGGAAEAAGALAARQTRHRPVSRNIAATSQFCTIRRCRCPSGSVVLTRPVLKAMKDDVIAIEGGGRMGMDVERFTKSRGAGAEPIRSAPRCPDWRPSVASLSG